MTRQEMLKFLREKVATESDRTVLKTKDGDEITLRDAILAATMFDPKQDKDKIDLEEHMKGISTETLDVAASAKVLRASAHRRCDLLTLPPLLFLFGRCFTDLIISTVCSKL